MAWPSKNPDDYTGKDSRRWGLSERAGRGVSSFGVGLSTFALVGDSVELGLRALIAASAGLCLFGISELLQRWRNRRA
jgi:hypothetical protein